MAKISKPELLRRLVNLRATIDASVENINYGGCGVIAAAVGKALIALDVPCDVLTPWRPAAEVRGNVKKTGSARDWSSNGLSRSHLVIRFRIDGETMTWDTACGIKGPHDVGNYKTGGAEFGDGLTIRECTAMCARQAGWNPDFDRRQIPMVRAAVAHHVLHGM